MNRYKKLISDTVIFAIGSFGSKILSFALFPLFMHALDPAALGTSEIITQTGNLLFYFATFGIVSGVVRYGLDASYNKRDVFTVGVRITFLGLFAMGLLSPLLKFVPGITTVNYALLTFLFVAASSLRSLCSQFTRSVGYMKLYAFDGILSTLFVVIFNLIFLLGFKWGAVGTVLATVVSDFLSAIFLFTVGRLHRFVSFKAVDKNTRNSMLRYSLPMISNNVSWWITNVSNRYILQAAHGDDEVGLFAAANKLPNLITIISNVFMDAWQVSAVAEMSKRERRSFFTRIFRNYWGVVFALTSGIIMVSEPLMRILTSKEAYQNAWNLIPILCLSVAFSCFVSFLGSVYMLEYKSMRSLVTTVIGAVLNVVLTVILVQKYATMGAAIALLVSYLVVFVVRAVDVKQFVDIKYPIPRMTLTCVLITIQTATRLSSIPNKYLIPIQLVLCFVIVLMNTREILGKALLFLDLKLRERRILKEMQAENTIEEN